MLKARMGNVGILGLTAGNVEMLQTNAMIVRLEELGPGALDMILIVYGDTWQEMIARVEATTGVKVPVREEPARGVKEIWTRKE